MSPPGTKIWQAARTELLVAAGLVVAAGVAGYAVAGGQALVIVAIAAVAAALLGARMLVPPALPPSDVTGGSDESAARSSFTHYWHYLADLRDGIAVRPAYQSRLRPSLEHLLAARLAERHGVNLYREPEAARRLLCRDGRDNDLWAWIDPAQAGREEPPAEGRASAQAQPPGIPRRVLERLINRLEQL
jgi:hypothetical protein